MSHSWHRQAGFIARFAMTTPSPKKIPLLFAEHFWRVRGEEAGLTPAHHTQGGLLPLPPSVWGQGHLSLRIYIVPVLSVACVLFVLVHRLCLLCWANAAGGRGGRTCSKEL